MAVKLGLQVIAKISGYGDAAQSPELFTTSSALAIPKAISSAGIEASQVDLYEINEAFSVVALANQKFLGPKPEKVNIHRGAVSLWTSSRLQWCPYLGYSFGVLRQKKGKYGVGVVCNEGGCASGVIIELV